MTDFKMCIINIIKGFIKQILIDPINMSFLMYPLCKHTASEASGP